MARVAGMRAGDADRISLMILQAFFDESEDDQFFCVGGFISSPSKWAAFSAEWADMLPKWGTLSSSGHYHFKMSEMAAVPERMSRVNAFANVVSRHVEFGILCYIRKADVNRAMRRIALFGNDGRIVKLKLKWIENLYLLAFSSIFGLLNPDSPDSIIPMIPGIEGGIIPFFDERMEKKRIFEGWEAIKRSSGSFAPNLNSPRFEEDHKFLPLQAADFISWWGREWVAAGNADRERIVARFPFKAAGKNIKMAMCPVPEQFIFERARQLIQENLHDIEETLITYSEPIELRRKVTKFIK